MEQDSEIERRHPEREKSAHSSCGVNANTKCLLELELPQETKWF